MFNPIIECYNTHTYVHAHTHTYIHTFIHIQLRMACWAIQTLLFNFPGMFASLANYRLEGVEDRVVCFLTHIKYGRTLILIRLCHNYIGSCSIYIQNLVQYKHALFGILCVCVLQEQLDWHIQETHVSSDHLYNDTTIHILLYKPLSVFL